MSVLNSIEIAVLSTRWDYFNTKRVDSIHDNNNNKHLTNTEINRLFKLDLENSGALDFSIELGLE